VCRRIGSWRSVLLRFRDLDHEFSIDTKTPKQAELRRKTKRFTYYIPGLVSLIGLGVMVLCGMISIGDILGWEWKLVQLCPWYM
jgi:hypothetical protein